MTNAVITYTGNVCSTPMISYAGLTGDVFVPIREQFDLYQLRQVVPEPARQASVFAHTLSALYERSSAGLFDLPGFKRYPDWTEVPAAAAMPHVLFKWRPFAFEMPDHHLVASTFERHDVRAAMLVRRSVAEQAVKFFMSRRVYGDAHQQFVAGAMTADEYETYQAGQRDIRILIGPEEIAAVREQARGFLERTVLTIASTRRYFPHVASPPVIIAEDIFRPMLDRTRFDATLSALLGPVRPVGEQAHPEVRKAGLDLSHCANAEDVLADPELRAVDTKYQALIGGLPLLVPPSAGK